MTVTGRCLHGCAAVVCFLLCATLTQVSCQQDDLEHPYGELWHPQNCSRETYLHYGTCDLERWLKKNSNCQVCRDMAASSISSKLSTSLPEYDDFACVEDLMLTEEQQEYCMTTLRELEATGGSTRKRRSIRRFAAFPNAKWPTTIIYKIDGNLTVAEAHKIKTAIAMWTNNTCIKFKEVPVGADVKEQHLLFAKTPHLGCYSYIGRTTKDFPQTIFLSLSCFTSAGYLAHEIGHTLGMFHKHQRHDGDSYIEVVARNIRFGAEGNFASMSSQHMDHMGVEYDFATNMHYRAKAFSLFGGDTIRTKDPLYQCVIGQRVELSFSAIKLINFAYCNDTCSSYGRLPRKCERGGYQDPKNCSHCRCPDGWGGTYCQDVAPPVNGKQHYTINVSITVFALVHVLLIYYLT